MNKFFAVFALFAAVACVNAGVYNGAVSGAYGAANAAYGVNPAVAANKVVPVYNIPIPAPIYSAPVSYAAPVAYGAPIAPVSYAAPATYAAQAAPVSYAAPDVAIYSSAAAAGSSPRSLPSAYGPSAAAVY